MNARCARGRSSRGGPARPRWLGAVAGAVAALCACDGGSEGFRSDGSRSAGCRFGVEHPVATAEGFAFDALALVPMGEDQVALWSEPAGLFGRRLGADGQPLGGVVPIGPRCRGGMAAVGAAGRIHVVCLDVPHRLPRQPGPPPQAEVHGQPPKPREASGASTGADRVGQQAAPRLLWLVREGLPGLAAVGPARTLAEVGVGSDGVALAQARPGAASGTAPGQLWVAWRDIHGLRESVQLLSLEPDAAAGGSEVRTLSAAGAQVGPPALRISSAGPEVVWAERALSGQHLRRALWLGRADGRRSRLVDAAAEAPRPTWVPAPHGRPVLAFRGRRRGLYLARLGPDAKLGKGTRVARADGSARPAFAACSMGLVAATPRRYAGDDFVGVNVLAADFSRRTPERQFYEDAHGFGAAAVTCSPPGALLLIGERARFERPHVALRAVVLRCG